MKKLNQGQVCFWILLEAYHADPNKWLHAGNFCQVEKNIPAYGWCFLSYKGATRISDTVYAELPSDVIERKLHTGKSGATYYVYRLKAPQDLFGWKLPSDYKHVYDIYNQ